MASIRNMMSYKLSNFKYDATAGIVVFLVAIPLCLGIALASGAPLFSGIIAGIIGGIIVGTLSESAVSVSGPAAGMVAVVIAAIAALGGFNAFLVALTLSGIIQIIIGTLRAGFIADYIPSNVIQGLLCAIGILIIIKQLPFAFSYTSENQQLLDFLKDGAENLDIQMLSVIQEHINIGAIIISVISLALLIFFDKTKNSTLKLIPGPIVVVIIGTLINEFYAFYSPELTQYSTELVNIPVSSDLQTFLSNLQQPDWSAWRNPNVYLYAIVLAAVASLEALLNLEASEKLDKLRRYCSRNRELVAQGIGNTLSGLVGGLPITSVVVRSSVNIQTGARTKFSTIIHGILMLIVVLLIPHWMNAIPLAALAAILMFVGYKLTKPAIYKEMYSQGTSRFIPFIVTLITIVSTDLLTGTIIGLLTGFFFILRDSSRIQLDVVNEKHTSGDVKRLILPQHMSFLRKASLVSELDSIPDNSKLIIDARYTKYIDRDILEVIDVFRTDQAPNKQIALNMLGFRDKYEVHDHIEFLNVTTYDTQASLKPIEVLEILKEGNKRFINDSPIHRSLPDEIRASSETQHPVAIVLGCIDSRVPVETIFDMGVGDVFVARIAGNVINEDLIASMEFACHVAGAKLILVLGHTYCGAIKAACDNGTGGHLGELLGKIKPAIEAETTTHHHRDGGNTNFVTNVTKLNIENSLKQVFGKSAILNRMINEGNVGLMGALYDIKSGVVNFHEDFYRGA